MRRLFVPRSRLEGDRAELEASEAHSLHDVLRLAPGALIEVFDGEGGAREGRVCPEEAAGRIAQSELHTLYRFIQFQR